MQRLLLALHESALHGRDKHVLKYFGLKTSQLLFQSVEAWHTIIHTINSILNFLL